MYDFMLHEMPIQTQARGNMMPITCISMPGYRGYNFHCRYEVQLLSVISTSGTVIYYY